MTTKTHAPTRTVAGAGSESDADSRHRYGSIKRRRDQHRVGRARRHFALTEGCDSAPHSHQHQTRCRAPKDMRPTACAAGLTRSGDNTPPRRVCKRNTSKSETGSRARRRALAAPGALAGRVPGLVLVARAVRVRQSVHAARHGSKLCQQASKFGRGGRVSTVACRRHQLWSSAVFVARRPRASMRCTRVLSTRRVRRAAEERGERTHVGAALSDIGLVVWLHVVVLGSDIAVARQSAVAQHARGRERTSVKTCAGRHSGAAAMQRALEAAAPHARPV